MTSVRRILFPTDFSAPAAHALDYAIELARCYGSTLWLVHVIEPPVLFGAELSSPDLVTAAIEVQREAAEAALSHARDRCAEAGVPALTQIETGYPSRLLVELSKGADMIVMATRGRSGVAHFVLGSVAERVLRAAKCPVMVVAPKHAAAPTASAA